MKILIAKDEAFNFTYRVNIDAFRAMGDVLFFSPLHDDIAIDCDLLYLPGGYPELFLNEITANSIMCQRIKDYAEAGGRIFAECGGFMYLCHDIDGTAMCDVFPFRATMQNARLHLGYRQMEYDGKLIKGHEFHYSDVIDCEHPAITKLCIQRSAKGTPVNTALYKYKNVTAGYTHWYNPLTSPLPSTGGVGGGSLKPLMLVGTGSDVGKSIIATGLCRIFLQEGYHPAPFKAQNMALNSYATPEGYEIGRAQAVQAEAAGVPCHTDMNPLLLKPNSEHTTQVVLNGKPIGNRSAYDYFRREGREELRTAVNAAFDRLAARYSPIIMEGAGSVTEINLRDSDLVNMPMARHADAAVILVADIDRGGVFASCYGSIMLQTPEDRQRIKGIIVNKFRGDIRLFDEGRRMIEDLCGVPVLGVVPMFKDIVIEEEDSVELEQKLRSSVEGKINVAVVLLRHISNFTDFNVLERDERVNLFYTNNITDIEKADIIILPGTKATLDDLFELRRNGVAQAIIRAHRNGKMVIGICGGYQMLGQMILDPDGIEGSIPQLPGLGLLDMTTTMKADKRTCQVEFDFNGTLCRGYEIHQGISTIDAPYVLQDNCLGSYIHGILDNAAVIEHLLRPFADKASSHPTETIDDFKNRQYDLLADHLRKHVDINAIVDIMHNSQLLPSTKTN